MPIECVLLKFFSTHTGSPAPKVKWFENGKELPTEANDFSYPSRTTNKLVVKNLSRIHQHAVYTCQASNFPNKFVYKNITIELYCKYFMLCVALSFYVLKIWFFFRSETTRGRNYLQRSAFISRQAIWGSVSSVWLSTTECNHLVDERRGTCGTTIKSMLCFSSPSFHA